MKSIILIFATFLAISTYAQIPSYYIGVDFTLTGMPLKSALTSKISSTHTNQISYSQVWNVLKQSDLDPTNSGKVLLVYGWNDTDGNETTDRSRSKSANGGANSGEWNREHVYPKSLATPELGSSGPGADAHNLKPADVGNNGARGYKKFKTGSGNGGTIGSYWYPGDEWKGDVARIYMYMYVRYTTQCKPANACVGNPVTIDLNMVDLLLQWNIEDPVNDYEMNRNNQIYNTQGNRNPFIDNPYLATLIWGGENAENNWTELNTISNNEIEDKLIISVYPNPTIDGIINIGINTINLINKIEIYDISGKVINNILATEINSNKLTITDLERGIYFIKISSSKGILTKKIIVK